jgi:hypothetical protein
MICATCKKFGFTKKNCSNFLALIKRYNRLQLSQYNQSIQKSHLKIVESVESIKESEFKFIRLYRPIYTYTVFG